MAVADANYCFTMVDIGSAGRRSDGGIFEESLINRALQNNTLHVPRPEPIEAGGPDIPYVLVGNYSKLLNITKITKYQRIVVVLAILMFVTSTGFSSIH